MISSQRIKAAQFLGYLAKSAYKHSQPSHLDIKQKLSSLEQIYEKLRNSNTDPEKLERLDLKISALKLKLDKLSLRP